MIVDNLLEQIKLGRQGKNKGYSIGLSKLENYIDGLTKGTNTLIISGSGSGKTSLVLYSYVYRPLMEHLDDDNFRCTYFSLEMNRELVLAKILSMYLFETYGVEVSVKELLSRKRDYTLSDDLYKLVLDSENWLKKVSEKLFIYDKGLNADNMYAILMKQLEKLGTFTETENHKQYTPNNSDLLFEVIIDHMGLLRPIQGRSQKQEIDLASAYAVTLRNMCNISFTMLSQVNRDASSTDRRKFGGNIMNYQLSDAKDSGGPTEDADIVLAIFNPNKQRLSSYNDYNIEILGDNFRSITVLKNRYGEVDIEVGCNFFGRVGMWHELPLAGEISDFNFYTDPSYILSGEVETIDKTMIDNKQETDNDYNFNFMMN